MIAPPTSELFPRGIALGSAFCNRQHERAQLAANLLAGRPRHSWISGRRRHGKSSLIAQTLADVHKKRGMRIEHAAVDVSEPFASGLRPVAAAAFAISTRRAAMSLIVRGRSG